MTRNDWEVIKRIARREKETEEGRMEVGELKTRELRLGRGREGGNITFRSPKAGTLREYDPKASATRRDCHRERNGV